MTAFAEGAQERVWRTFAAEMAKAPALIRQWIAEHRSDRDGRCSSPRCTAGGLGYGLRWPCTLYAVAVEALRLLDQSKTTYDAERRTPRNPTACQPCVNADRTRNATDVQPKGDDLPSGEESVDETPTVDPLDAEIRAFFDAHGVQDTGAGS